MPYIYQKMKFMDYSTFREFPFQNYEVNKHSYQQQITI